MCYLFENCARVKKKVRGTFFTERPSTCLRDTSVYRGIQDKNKPSLYSKRGLVLACVISLRTEEHDELPLSRTSFFPSYEGLLLRSLLS